MPSIPPSLVFDWLAGGYILAELTSETACFGWGEVGQVCRTTSTVTVSSSVFHAKPLSSCVLGEGFSRVWFTMHALSLSWVQCFSVLCSYFFLSSCQWFSPGNEWEAALCFSKEGLCAFSEALMGAPCREGLAESPQELERGEGCMELEKLSWSCDAHFMPSKMQLQPMPVV